MPEATELQTELVSQLEKKTRSGSLHWQESGRGCEYLARTGDYSVTVSINHYTELFNIGVDVRSPISVAVMLPEGVAIERFEIQPIQAEYPIARKLYDSVASSAAKKPQMLTQLIEQLAK